MGPLTPREREIALMAGRGLTNGEIAAELFISEQSVKNTLMAVYRKLPPTRHYRKRMMLVAWALAQERGGEVA